MSTPAPAIDTAVDVAADGIEVEIPHWSVQPPFPSNHSFRDAAMDFAGYAIVFIVGLVLGWLLSI